MPKYFNLLAIMSILTIVNIPLSVNAGQIRLRTIKESSYTKIIYVNTGNPNTKPRTFQIIDYYPSSLQPYHRNISRTIKTYIAGCDIYQMSGIIQEENYDENNELISLNRYTNSNSRLTFHTPTALSLEELALNVTCKTKK